VGLKVKERAGMKRRDEKGWDWLGVCNMLREGKRVFPSTLKTREGSKKGGVGATKRNEYYRNKKR